MTVLYAITIDSGTDAQNAAVRAEMEQALGSFDDPLAILIAEEEEGLMPEGFDNSVDFWRGLS